jgi:pimeloyl-ACP methyl ester carboxylesterase
VQTQFIPARSAGASAGCIVLLPGAQQGLSDFVRGGFDTAIHERALPWDLVLAAPQLAHLTDRSWLASLHSEVIVPARERGHTLWLGGISLGAFMALRFCAQHPGQIDGLCLLAPYLGSRIVAAEIARCESLQRWQPGVPADDDDERQVWRYVRGLRPPPPRIFHGFGRSDRFADTQRLLARALPPACSLQIDGGHDWPVWRQLWDNFLDHHLQP